MEKIEKQIHLEFKATFTEEVAEEVTELVEDIVGNVNDLYQKVLDQHEHMRLALINLAGSSTDGEVVRKALQGLRITLYD